MARKSKNRVPTSQQVEPSASLPWYKRLWVVVFAVSGVVSAILLNGPNLLQNARILPTEIHQTVSQFLSWFKDDADWTGHWSSFPEGIVDMADMHLSDVDMQITVWAKGGGIDGTIATKSICKSIPVLNYVLLRGEISGTTANVIAWDIVQGHKTDFAQLRLDRDGDIITVTPVNGRKEWFPETARLGKHPLELGKEPEPDQTFCDQERKSFSKSYAPLQMKRVNQSFQVTHHDTFASRPWIQTLGQKTLTPTDLDAIRSRIQRASVAVREASGSGYQTSYQAEGTDFTTNFKAVGVKAPEQLEDDFLNLFVWIWSLKDYLKSCFEAKGLRGKAVEEEVNRCQALTYVADIANRAKHGELRASRSNDFAELIDVGFIAPQECIERITVAGTEVILHIKDPQMLSIRATVATRSGDRHEALAVLTEAMECWETKVIARIAP